MRLHLLVLVFIATQALAPQAVFAHAELARSEPPANTVLDQSPSRVTIWFTEPVEPAYSDIRVFESTGGRVDQANSAVSPNDPASVSVAVASLPPGVYTVAWRNSSRVDGHSVRGTFVFSVQQPISGPDIAGPESPPLFPSPLEPFLKWASLLGAMALAGGLAFFLFVARPSLAAFPEARRQLRSRIDTLLWFAVGLLFLAEIGRLIVHAATLNDVPLADALGAPMGSILTGTDWGHLWLWRIALVAAFAMAAGLSAVLAMGPPDEEVEQPWTQAFPWLLLAIAMGVLLTISLSSHVAALPGLRAAGVFTDYVHLLAAAFWAGGLLHLAAGLPILFKALAPQERGRTLSSLVPRFSTMALLSVGTLVITGAYSAWALVGSWPALPRTAYGKELLVKLALMVPLLCLAAANLFWVGRRAARDAGAAAWLRKLVIGEALLAVAVVLAVGALTSTEPARKEAARIGIGQPGGLSFESMAGDVHVGLSVAPGQIGSNRLLVTIQQHNGQPIAQGADVAVRLRHIGSDLGAIPVSVSPEPQGTFLADQALLTIAGPWEAEILVRRPGSFDTQAVFRFEIGGAQGAGSSSGPSPATGGRLLGIELLLLGLLFAGTGLWRLGWRSPQGIAALSPGVAAAVIGAALIIQGVMGDGEAAPDVNPIAPTDESMSIGRQVYQAYCETCHGATGKGDGPGAAGLNPPPGDLTVHGPLHDDAELYRFITKGVSGTTMVGWENTLSSDQRWHVVNYLRFLGPKR